MNLVLIGLRGSGKSTCGRLLAERLGWRFEDADEVIQARAGKSIERIFAEDGEPRFRSLEADVLRELAGLDHAVIAPGGGAVLRAENVAALRRNGFVVHLDAPPDELWERVAADAKSAAQRPVLVSAARSGAEELACLHRDRAAAYAAARHAVVNVSGRTPAEVAGEILRLLPSPS